MHQYGVCTRTDTSRSDREAKCWKKRREESPTAIEEWLERLDVEVVPIGIRHLKQLASLPIQGDHRDPNDRLIIAQAIADRVPLISSDRKFSRYRGHGLNFVFNER